MDTGILHTGQVESLLQPFELSHFTQQDSQQMCPQLLFAQGRLAGSMQMLHSFSMKEAVAADLDRWNLKLEMLLITSPSPGGLDSDREGVLLRSLRMRELLV